MPCCRQSCTLSVTGMKQKSSLKQLLISEVRIAGQVAPASHPCGSWAKSTCLCKGHPSKEGQAPLLCPLKLLDCGQQPQAAQHPWAGWGGGALPGWCVGSASQQALEGSVPEPHCTWPATDRPKQGSAPAALHLPPTALPLPLQLSCLTGSQSPSAWRQMKPRHLSWKMPKSRAVGQ